VPARSRAIERASVQRFAQLFPHELAQFAETLPAQEAARHIETLPRGDAAAVFKRLRPDAAADVLDRLPDEAFSKLVPQLEPGPVAAILARLDSDRRSSRLQVLPENYAREISQLMTYTSDAAGGIMDPRVTTFRPSSTVKEVIKRIRSLRGKRISDVFVIDDDGKLTGAVSLQDLVPAQPSDTLDQLVRREPVSVQATASREQVLEVFGLSRAPSVPVTDFEGRVVGVIRHESLMAAAQAEATADVQTMVGASKDERALSKVSFAVRRRLPWLQVNLGTAFLAAAVVGLFEGTIAQFTALAVLLPVVAGQSGNTGSQALAVTMRGLALREIRGRHWLRVSLKEASAGAINGVAVALVTALAVYIWSDSLGLTAVIAIAMVTSMAIAGLAGASIPMILERLGQDPAQASSIVLTTVTDVVGFFSFLGLATMAAGWL